MNTEDIILEAQARLRIQVEQLTKRVQRLENNLKQLDGLEDRISTIIEAGTTNLEVGKKLDLLDLDKNWNDNEHT